MANRLTIKAATRSATPSALRRTGSIPAILYGPDQPSQPLQLNEREFTKILHQAGQTSLINISIEKPDDSSATSHTVLLRAVQRHPVHDHILHVDLYKVRLDKAIRTNVPFNFIGESPAVKDLSGVLVRNMDEADLAALPNDLPHDISVDISVLKDFDTVIRIEDLSLPKEIELFHEPDEVIALVQPPRTEEELQELEEEAKEDVESVEGVKEETSEDTDGETKETDSDNNKEASSDSTNATDDST